MKTAIWSSSPNSREFINRLATVATTFKPELWTWSRPPGDVSLRGDIAADTSRARRGYEAPEQRICAVLNIIYMLSLQISRVNITNAQLNEFGDAVGTLDVVERRLGR